MAKTTENQVDPAQAATEPVVSIDTFANLMLAKRRECLTSLAAFAFLHRKDNSRSLTQWETEFDAFLKQPMS